jgi:hypothetical protein
MARFAKELIRLVACEFMDARIRVGKPRIGIHTNNDVWHLFGKDTEVLLAA